MINLQYLQLIEVFLLNLHHFTIQITNQTLKPARRQQKALHKNIQDCSRFEIDV